MKFLNRTVIITGAGAGIGEGIAKAFAEKGANVVIAESNEENGIRTANNLSSKNYSAIFIKTDVKDERSIETLFEGVKERFGGIDILINNAGISKFTPFFDLTSSGWDEVINTNLKSVFLCSQAAARLMKETGGRIVNISSTRAFMSEPDTEAYSASKGGIIALTHALARTLGPFRITVNSISPGWIETGNYSGLTETDHFQHPSGRVGKPVDVAKCCLYLCDPENDFITGENIVIDGGMTRKMMYEE